MKVGVFNSYIRTLDDTRIHWIVLVVPKLGLDWTLLTKLLTGVGFRQLLRNLRQRVSLGSEPTGRHELSLRQTRE